MLSVILSVILSCACAAALATDAVAPPPDDPVALVREYFRAVDPAARAAAAARIASHRDYGTARLRDWLHRGAPFADLAPGSREVVVDIGAGQSRHVFLLIPEGYRPDRAWPLVYALHPSGLAADEWGRAVQRMLGRMARDFVVASPEYGQNYIAAKPPFVAEHAAILDAVARRVHVDAGRVYSFGYSKGGFGAWFVALYYPDRIDHAFRHLHQASCYWLEGLTWVGTAWGDPSPRPEPARPDEPEAVALARTLEPLLGRLTGVRDGQTLRVTRRHVGDVVVWLGERTIDWDRPLTIEVDGKVAFSGKAVPDPTLALARAAASMDFDHLRFAGIRVSASGEATVLTAETVPEPVWRTGR